MKKKRVLEIIILLLLGVMLFSGYKVFKIYQNDKQVRQQYEQIEQMIQQEPEETVEEDGNITSQQKYQSIYEQNNDFIGWIYIPGTELSYPVMHTPSDPEYYLRKDFNGKYSIHGVPFVDFRCVIDESDSTIIYGHNMMNGTMFGVLENYKDENFWQQHRYIGFDTMNGYGIYEVAMFGIVDLLTDTFNYIESVDFGSQQTFDDYISKVKAYACYETDVELCYGDKFILLSTCETNNADGRYIVIAKKISDEELSMFYK